MRAMSTELMDDMIEFIDLFYCERQAAPSCNEIAMAFDISKSSAFRYLMEMDKRGLIEYDGRSRVILTPMIKKYSGDSSVCPVVGSIHCGDAEEQEENIIEYVSLPTSLIGKGRWTGNQ